MIFSSLCMKFVCMHFQSAPQLLYSQLILSSLYTMAVRASRTDIFMFARSLSKDFVACEITNLRNMSTVWVLYRPPLLEGTCFEYISVSHLTHCVHAAIRNSLVSSETSISTVFSSSFKASAVCQSSSSAFILSLQNKPALHGVCRLFELLLVAETLLRTGLLHQEW